MKPEDEMTEEVRQLLDSLEEHGKNTRRQQQLSELMDGLLEIEQGNDSRHCEEWSLAERRGNPHIVDKAIPTELVDCFVVPPRNDVRRKFYPVWWIIGAAAAVLLLWLMFKPTAKETPNMNEEILVEKTTPVDSVKDEVEEVILEEPIIEEELLAEETQSKLTKSQLVVPQKPKTKTEKPKEIIVEKPQETAGEENYLAEATLSESAENTDTSTVGSNNIPASIEENLSPLNSHLSPQSSPQRRVIRSLNLVCYECQTENGEWEVENGKWKVENSQLSTFNFPLSTQAQDPNMKNGAMTFELKLN